jgi:hypothetical protein
MSHLKTYDKSTSSKHHTKFDMDYKLTFDKNIYTRFILQEKIILLTDIPLTKKQERILSQIFLIMLGTQRMLGLDTEIFYLSRNILTQYLHVVENKFSEIEIIAITCVFIASKFETSDHPTLDDFYDIVKHRRLSYEKHCILEKELMILKAIKFSFNTVSTNKFILLMLNSESESISTNAEFIALVQTLHMEMYKFLPSLIAFSVIIISKIGLKDFTLLCEDELTIFIKNCIENNIKGKYHHQDIDSILHCIQCCFDSLQSFICNENFDDIYQVLLPRKFWLPASLWKTHFTNSTLK